jgi:hypothetical protein
MKRLLKHEWKYYALFLVGILVLLIIINGQVSSWMSSTDFHAAAVTSDESLLSAILEILVQLSWFTNDNLTHNVILCVLISLGVIKTLFFWQEKERSGMEFLGSLPVTKAERRLFHLLMDSLLIVLTVSIYTLYMYCQITNELQNYSLELPWLGSALFGEMITCITYLLFLLGIIYVLETFFVDGFIRVIGTAGSLYMGYLILESAFSLNKNATWMQNIYGFFLMEKPGNGYYEINTTEMTSYWTAICSNGDVYYQGTSVTDLMIGDAYFSPSLLWSNWSDDVRLTNFSHVNSYLGYALTYLGLGLLLMWLSLYLTKRQELSKQGFFFPAGRYVFCLLLSCSFAGAMLTNSTALWHRVLIVLSGVLLYLILNYMMNLERKKLPH